MSTSDTTAPSFRRTLQLLCASLMSSLVVILVAVTAAMGSDGTGTTPVWAFAVVIALGVAAITLITSFGYRTTPVEPGTAEEDARKAAAGALQTTTVLRFVIAESVALVALALAFAVAEGGLYLLFVGVAIAELLMVLHVWPSERVIGRVQESLEREGGRSYLREALDAPPPARGAQA